MLNAFGIAYHQFYDLSIVCLFISGFANFSPLSAKLYIPPLSVTKYSPEDTCNISDSLRLFDEDVSTCINVQGVLQLTIASTEPLHRLMIMTRGMDCSKHFHVSVYVKRPLNHCNHVDVGELLSFSYVDGTAELSECVYAVPQGDGDIMIRFSAVLKASVCSVMPNWYYHCNSYCKCHNKTCSKNKSLTTVLNCCICILLYWFVFML